VVGVIRWILTFIVPLSSISLSISGNFFGINYWYFEKLSEEDRRAVKSELKNLEIDTIRIGGLWYDANGIKTWVLEDFFGLCEDLNATPIVQIPLNKHTTDEMLDFVNKVRRMWKRGLIWSVGNEPDIYEKLSFSWLAKEPMSVVMKKYEDFFEEFQRKGDMLIFPDITSRWRDRNFVKKLLKFHPDVFSIHRYPFNHVKSIDEIFRDVEKFHREMSELKKTVGIPIALTETNLSWNWNFSGKFSPEGEYAALWMVSIYVRAIVLDLWNVSIWSTVNDSSLSLLLVENGKVIRRPSFEFMRVFKDIPRDLKKYHLSKDLDWLVLGNSVLIVNRTEKSEEVVIDGKVYHAVPLGVVRYDSGQKVFERSVESEMR
jgi:hypothetical protein